MSKQLIHSEHLNSNKTASFHLLVPNLSSPYNVGGLFRLADALGIERLYFSGDTPLPPNKKIKKTARSTEQFVPFTAVDKPLALLQDLQKVGYKIICLEICEYSIDIETLSLVKDEKLCLVLGEENIGVRQDFLDLADAICHIPMQGKNSSMNVVSACAIACYAIINKIK
jgi:tRNA G18 (ribose-2'-O)-methylase SpoU